MLAFLRRRVTGDYVVDEYGFDPEIIERVPDGDGAAARHEVVPGRGPRRREHPDRRAAPWWSPTTPGTVPLDGMMTMFAVHDDTGRNLRPLGADLVFRLPFIGELARKAGATLACNEDAERMLRGGELAGVWPEGFKGIGKPYSERYKLQRFGRGGFVSAAMRDRGADRARARSSAPRRSTRWSATSPRSPGCSACRTSRSRRSSRCSGPLGLVPLPSKWIIEFGEPIRTDSYDPGAADDPMLVFNVTDQVRETIQQTLYTLLMRRKSVFH